MTSKARSLETLPRDIGDWRITFVDTGLDASVGQRLRAVGHHSGDDDVFLANYGDVLTDAPLDELVERFRRTRKLAAFIAVRPRPYTFHRHQDHAVVAELAWQTFRDQLILEYEIPKFDGDLGQPNLFTAETVEREIAHLLEAFPSQRDRSWFSADKFRAVLRLRGIESNAPSGFAEGFTARKLTLTLDDRAP